MKIAVDTNVLIYVLQGHDEFGDVAHEVLSSFNKQDILVSEAVSAEILADKFFEDRTAMRQANDFLDTLAVTYVPTTRQIYTAAANLRRANAVVKLPDAIHLASAWSSGADFFVTNDRQLVTANRDDNRIVLLKKFAGQLQ